MRFKINHIYEDDLQTIGTLICGDRLLFTMERPWKQNRPFISRIPPGDFVMKVKIVEDYDSKTFRPGIRLSRVGGDAERFYINMEVANYASQLMGCIGVAAGVSTNARGKYMVTRSNLGLEILTKAVQLCEDDGIECLLTIEDRF